MNHETERPAGGPPTVDDDQLAALVRASVDDWRLPPQRIDQPTWRDRVSGRGARRRRGWFARLAGPAGAAVIVTVLVAFAAVWLTVPRTTPGIAGVSPSASGALPSGTGASPTATGSSPRPSASSRTTGSGLPVLQIDGALPDPARIMVQVDRTYQIADLSSGTLDGVSIGSHSGPTTLIARASGGWSCVCGDWTGSNFARPRGLDLTLESVTADGIAQPPIRLRTVRGEPDLALNQDDQPELVDATATGSADGRYAFVGWSARHGAAGWTAGIDVVDLSSERVVDSTLLPVAEPAGAGGRPTTRIAPRAVLSPAGDAILVSSFWYVNDPATMSPAGTDHWMASFSEASIGGLKAAGATTDETCFESDNGPIDATTYYLVCTTSSGRLTVDRRHADGSPIGETEIPGMASGLAEASMFVRQGDRLFMWDPIVARLARIDLRTGVVDGATGTAAVPAMSPLDAVASVGRQIGRWLAPPAAAKVLLQPALVASADGTRIYGLGVDGLGGDGGGGSRGIFAFDPRSLEPVGHWAPTADLTSLAISPDGRFVYAAGQEGVDAAGHQAAYPASVTVYDTTDGSVRLIAGNLGSVGLFFPGPTAR